MVIAINARFLIKDKLEGYGYFINQVIRIWTNQHPQHQFHIILDREFGAPVNYSENVHIHVVGPQARHPILWKVWFDVRVPILLKKIKADIFLSPDGFCSLTTKVPQCLIIHDLGFLHYPDTYLRNHLLYYKWFTLRFVQKAKTIATVSNFSKTDILIKYKIAPQKVSVVYSAAKDVFKPIDYEAQQVIKDKFTGGREYLIYVGAIQPRKNLLNLLKAYSLFKKRLKTEMKLVFAGRMAWKNDQLLELLNTYKHKDDVVLTGYLDENELSALVASAYGLVYPSVFEGFGVPVLEAMQCHVPVLTSENTSMQEIAEDAALYFDPNNISDIADKLMIIYKDEDLRKKLIEKGKLISKKYSWQNTADLLWDCMQKAIDGKEKI